MYEGCYFISGLSNREDCQSITDELNRKFDICEQKFFRMICHFILICVDYRKFKNSPP